MRVRARRSPVNITLSTAPVLLAMRFYQPQRINTHCKTILLKDGTTERAVWNSLLCEHCALRFFSPWRDLLAPWNYLILYRVYWTMSWKSWQQLKFTACLLQKIGPGFGASHGRSHGGPNHHEHSRTPSSGEFLLRLPKFIAQIYLYLQQANVLTTHKSSFPG